MLQGTHVFDGVQVPEDDLHARHFGLREQAQRHLLDVAVPILEVQPGVLRR